MTSKLKAPLMPVRGFCFVCPSRQIERGVEFRAWPLRPDMPNGLTEQASAEMTGDESRKLKVGDRVNWSQNQNDQGTIKATNWSGVSLKWDNRDEQSVLHNDMALVFLTSKK